MEHWNNNSSRHRRILGQLEVFKELKNLSRDQKHSVATVSSPVGESTILLGFLLLLQIAYPK